AISWVTMPLTSRLDPIPGEEMAMVNAAVRGNAQLLGNGGGIEQQSCRAMDEQAGNAVERTAQLQHFLARYLADELSGLRVDHAHQGASRAGIEVELDAVAERLGRTIDGGDRLAHALLVRRPRRPLQRARRRGP